MSHCRDGYLTDERPVFFYEWLANCWRTRCKSNVLTHSISENSEDCCLATWLSKCLWPTSLFFCSTTMHSFGCLGWMNEWKERHWPNYFLFVIILHYTTLSYSTCPLQVYVTLWLQLYFDEISSSHLHNSLYPKTITLLKYDYTLFWSYPGLLDMHLQAEQQIGTKTTILKRRNTQTNISHSVLQCGRTSIMKKTKQKKTNK